MKRDRELPRQVGHQLVAGGAISPALEAAWQAELAEVHTAEGVARELKARINASKQSFRSAQQQVAVIPPLAAIPPLEPGGSGGTHGWLRV